MLLVVEDESTIAQGLRDLLEGMGYPVGEPVASGEGAIRAAGERQPALVLMDIGLAGEMDGIEAARQIRERYGIPSIFLSARSDEATLRRARGVPPYSFLVKPFHKQELRAAVEMALYRAALEARERQHLRGLEILSRAAASLVQIDNDQELLEYVSDQAGLLAGNSEALEMLAGLTSNARQRLRVELALSQSEKDYRQIFENAYDAILIFDPEEMTILEANPRASEVYGYGREEFPGMRLEKISGDPAGYRARVREAVEKQSRVEFEAVQYRKDGAERFVQVSAALTAYKGRQVILSINRDNTERKLTEIRLDLNARRLSAMSRMGQIVTSSLDLGEVLQRVTAEAQLLMGVDSIAILLQEDQGELVTVAASDQDWPALYGRRIPIGAGIAEAVLRSGQAVMRDGLSTPGGQEKVSGEQSLLAVPLSLNESVIGVVQAAHSKAGFFHRDDQRTLEGVAIWAAIAIANARQYTTIQERLQESEAIVEIGRSLLGTLNLEQVLQMIVDSAQHLIPKVDRAVIHLVDERNNSLVMSAATGFDELQGPFFTIRPGEGVAGKVLAEGKTINVADTQTDSSYLPLGARDQRGSLLVAPIQSGLDLLGTLSVRSAVPNAFKADYERLLTILGVQAALAINNARLFAAEQRSRQLAESLLQHEKSTRAQLVQSEKLAALGRIVASVAHELNNPLHAIHNAIYLVSQAGKLNAQTQEDLQVALDETKRMANLIARLRETYRPATYEEFQEQELRELVEDVHSLLATHMRHKNIEFIYQSAAELPAVRVIKDQIRQVILNLCLNAIESMPEGGKLTVSSSLSADSREFLLTFKDSGPGIPVDILPNIFEPFYTTKEGGTGLGLAISYDIVQRHKGRIEVENVPQGGAIFKIWLPTGQPTNPTRTRKGQIRSAAKAHG